MQVKFIIDEEYDKSFVKDPIALAHVEEQYKVSYKFIKATCGLYQRSWDEINNDFSRYIEKSTDFPWFYDTYECVVSVVHGGISNWGGAPKVVRTWEENPYYMRRITAHEIILSHYFEIHRRHYNDSGLTDGQIWALAEIAAFALTSLTPEIHKFWPWNTCYYTNHNYPHVVDLQNELKEVFLNKNLKEYIQTGIALVRKHPNIGPSGL